MLDKTLCVLLAGGVGSRLFPLTEERTKPAVPFGAHYRIIDFALSNCLHSGLRRILVLTQYKSHSLQKHLRDGWSIFNPSLGEYITPVPPQMRTGDSWYIGTADAIYQNMYLVDRSGADYVVVLSGDHIYRMDYAAMLDFHKSRNSELTIACMEVSLKDARGFGVMETDSDSRIVAFEEKPNDPKPILGNDSRALASMGIYIFDKQLLADELLAEHANKSSEQDFGKNVIPRLIHKHRVLAYPFGGEAGRVKPDNYWRDVGTLESYYESNMELLAPEPPMDLYQKDWAIHSHLLQAPPARVVGEFGRDSDVDNVIMGGGAAVRGSSVRRTVLSGEVTVMKSEVSDSILCGDIVVGEGCELRRCIVDKHVRIPPGTKIGLDPELDARFTVSPEGIVVVPRGYQFKS